MKRFALIGHPLGHTMSPPLHQRLFALSGVEGTYQVLDIPPQELEETLPRLFSQLDGFNVTIPYKQAVIPYLNGLHETAARYGAVNTVICGDKTGCNTDCVGFFSSLQGEPLDGEVLICGAGGVGRMFACEAVLHGASVTLAVRQGSEAGALSLAQELAQKVPGCRVKVLTYPQLQEAKTRWHWLINATPVGMWPNTDAMPVQPQLLSQVDCIFDAIYNPVKTLLMQEGEKRGCRVIGGMGMLVHQAAQAHTHWYGARFAREDLEQLIAEMERKVAQSR